MSDPEPTEPGLPPGSRPPTADEVEDLMGGIEGALGEGEETPAPGPGVLNGFQVSLAGAIGCAFAAALAVNFGWEGVAASEGVSRYGQSLLAGAVLEGALLGLASGLAFSFWGRVDEGKLNAPTCSLILVALVAGYLLLASALLDVVLGTQGPSIPLQVATCLQLAAVLLAALIGFVKARLIPLRPMLGLAGGLFASAVIAELGGDYLGGGLSTTAGLPYAAGLPIAWTVVGLFGKNPLKTGTD